MEVICEKKLRCHSQFTLTSRGEGGNSQGRQSFRLPPLWDNRNLRKNIQMCVACVGCNGIFASLVIDARFHILVFEIRIPLRLTVLPPAFCLQRTERTRIAFYGTHISHFPLELTNA